MKKMFQKPVDFLQRLFAPLRVSADPPAITENGACTDLKTLVLEYYSTFAITIFQGVVYFTQQSTDELMLLKPAYKEAQEQYNLLMNALRQKAGEIDDAQIRDRVERIIREGSAAIVASSEAGQKNSGAFYDFMIDIMSVQKQCLDLVSDLEEIIQRRDPSHAQSPR
mgnify:CR=1 FL=1